MENKLENYKQKTFDDIKHIDENGVEFWYARELQIALEYNKWENFNAVLKKAIKACEGSKYNVLDHFPDIRKMVVTGDSIRKIIDYKLSRYACYLIVQNADPRKEVVALGQTYFAVQTRKQELLELNYENLTEDEKRIYKRNKTKRENLELNNVAKNAGVKDFGKFHNEGYKGLYNGETADGIAKRKGLRYREDILDNMSSDELAANEFRISLAKQKITNEKIKGENKANKAHFEVGASVRKTIKEMGGTMPEDLPTPNKSIKKLKQEKIKIN